MNEPLSPAAQSIHDAVDRQLDQDASFRSVTAAALRAAAARTEDIIGDIQHPQFAEGVKAAGNFLERIATELETTND